MKSFIFLLCLTLLAGCAAITGERMGQLQVGMTKDQIEHVLGKPDGYLQNGNTEVLQYTNRMMSGWGYDRADYHALLTNGKLSEWGAGTVRQNRSPVTPVLVYGHVSTN